MDGKVRVEMTGGRVSAPHIDPAALRIRAAADSFRARDKATEGVNRSMDAIRRISEQHRKRR